MYFFKFCIRKHRIFVLFSKYTLFYCVFIVVVFAFIVVYVFVASQQMTLILRNENKHFNFCIFILCICFAFLSTNISFIYLIEYKILFTRIIIQNRALKNKNSISLKQFHSHHQNINCIFDR